MPEYTYICDEEDKGCGHIFSLINDFRNYIPNPKCPDCKRKKPVRRCYEEDIGTLVTSVTLDESKLKLGQLAEKNTERLSSDEKQALYKKHNQYKQTKARPNLPKDMTWYGSPGQREVKMPQRKTNPRKTKKKPK